MPNKTTGLREPAGVLCDISGVLKDSVGSSGDVEIPQSAEAFKRLVSSGIPVILCTNESTYSTEKMAEKLERIGFHVTSDKIVSPVTAMKKLLKEEGHRPYFLVHERVADEFGGSSENPTAVVVGDAEDGFTYQAMDEAFRHLVKGDKKFYCLGKSKFYKAEDGLKLDVGCFIAGLEYSSQCKAECIGKPSRMYFELASSILGVPTAECVMIGDDIESDVGGAINAGIQGILVRTGKFRKQDEAHPTVKPTLIVDNFSCAVDAILATKN